MFKRTIVAVIITTLILTIFFSACKDAEKPEAAPGTEENFSEMGDAFASDLQRNILPNKETPENLPDYGYVLVKDDTTYGADSMTEFFMAYQGKNNGEVTAIFAGGSFVVLRIVSLNGQGYYMRYEYNKFKPDEIEISFLVIDKMDLKYNDGGPYPKWVLTMTVGKKEMTFEFKNPTEQD